MVQIVLVAATWRKLWVPSYHPVNDSILTKSISVSCPVLTVLRLVNCHIH